MRIYSYEQSFFKWIDVILFAQILYDLHISNFHEVCENYFSLSSKEIEYIFVRFRTLTKFIFSNHLQSSFFSQISVHLNKYFTEISLRSRNKVKELNLPLFKQQTTIAKIKTKPNPDLVKLVNIFQLLTTNYELL